MKTLFCAVTALTLAIGCGGTSAQQNYPDRPVRMLFGFSPGSDAAVRLVADKLSEALGKSVIVENVTGAAGGIAADRVAKAPPDGHTIGVLTGANIVINSSLYARLPYDPFKDLVPVSLIQEYPNTLVVNNDIPATTVAELVKLAKANPAKLTFAHSGIGTTQHLAGELFKSRAQIDIQQVPYRGPPQIATDLLAGRVSMSFFSPGTGLPLINADKIRALAVTSRTRAPFLPHVPTMIELGFPDFEVTAWFGVFVPARTPADIVERLNKEIVRIVALPDVRKFFLDSGYVPLTSTPEEFAARIRAEAPHWAKIIKEVGVQAIE
jgi:tripartite-type tricarboxylate transporter receptor subunit TctC